MDVDHVISYRSYRQDLLACSTLLSTSYEYGRNRSVRRTAEGALIVVIILVAGSGICAGRSSNETVSPPQPITTAEGGRATSPSSHPNDRR
jgi:hypothetical protein